MDHLDIVKRLCDNNCNTYIVGGGIRDLLLGKNPDDFDVVTEATPDQIAELFRDCNIKEVGKTFGVMVIEGYEVATFRHDIYDKDQFRVEFAETIHDDLSRRDLTVNAMAYCELTGELIDDHGGKQDLEDRIIKFVGNPDDRILEDPIRILRACRFIAKIDGTFETKTLLALQKHTKHLFNYKIAPERIRLEILKAMKIPNASKFFRALKLIGALKMIFPSLDKCWKHPHGRHHLEDVFEHNMLAGDYISTKYPIVKLAGYLHDVGKPDAYKDEKFIDHENVGHSHLRRELRLLTFSSKETKTITGLVRLHMIPIKDSKPHTLRRFLRRLNDHEITFKQFMRLRMADRKANTSRENYSIKEWVEMVSRVKKCHEEKIPFNAHSLALSGGDIISEFNITPGPIISKIQKHLLDRVVDQGISFNKPDILKVYVKQYLRENNWCITDNCSDRGDWFCDPSCERFKKYVRP